MTTFDSLVASEAIVKVEIQLGRKQSPKRLLFATPSFVDWLSERVSRDEPSSLGAVLSPVEQLDFLFYTFVSGKPLIHSRQFRAIRVERNAVWELKTVDFRIFGWFATRDCFVAVFGDWADHVKDHDLYRGYRLEVRRLRRALGVGDALCVEGVDPQDVISL
ncbi:hypothetical protein [Rhizobium sp. 60-20]|uniref:hypothetical protein n=1 Tax=Rhizobium sp. 60-20 TaxID=1895819 RepID=UPI000928DC77|nr:hypothetical protein [Rhizobium sp. 60-20]MBN8952398.1 hypothetical protein [Rhizobium tropici]OJY78886.1 MAG: hypothetical protein BGP09_23530 [Rhizobium sp. 60-20]